ncbi:MAG: DNA internalization-related competence protein ComEC/Rec2 [Candidatus Sumerlaeia bacterium]|nr:DNA internalization-related competence protein ComEC/Rec2 [Candidatus Sumerlaeia bacterium]
MIKLPYWNFRNTPPKETLLPDSVAGSGEHELLPPHELSFRFSFVALLAVVCGILVSTVFSLDSFVPGFVLLTLGLSLRLVWSRGAVLHISVVPLLLALIGFGMMLQVPSVREQTEALALREELFLTGGTDFVELRGVVSRPPATPLKPGSFLIEAGSTLGIRGMVHLMPAPVVVYPGDTEGLATLQRGDTVVMMGKLRPVADRPTARSFDSWLQAQGAVVSFSVDRLAQHTSSGNQFLQGVVHHARGFANKLEATYHRNLSAESAALLSAITLGRTTQLPEELSNNARRIGINHIFSVSGLHTAVVGVAALSFFRWLLPMRFVPFALFFTMAYFCALVEFRTPAIRSAAFVFLLSCVPWFQRQLDSLSLLSSIALVLVVLRPRVIFQVDFQLSFLCAAVLLLMFPLFSPLLEELKEAFAKRFGSDIIAGFLNGLLATIVTSVVIQLVLSPLLLGTIGEVSLIAPLGNILVLFLMPVLLLGGFLASMVELLTGWGGLFLLLEFSCLWISSVCSVLGAWDFAVLSTRFPIPVLPIFLLYTVVILGSWSVSTPILLRRQRLQRLCNTTLILLLGSTALLVGNPFQSQNLRVDFLNVGQGDATLIRYKHQVILVDAGPPPGTQVARELAELSVPRIDFLLLTHADADHTGGLPELFRKFPVDTIWVNNTETAGDVQTALREAAAEAQSLPNVFHVSRGERLNLAQDTTLTILHPFPGFQGEDKRNDFSLVALLSHGSVDVLLTGDAEADAEAALLAAYGEQLPNVEILKAGHHGSNTSSTPAFLATMQPQATLMSCGLHNRYNHPHPAVMQRFRDSGVFITRTDLMGRITLIAQHHKVVISPETFIGWKSSNNLGIPSPMPQLFPDT